MGKFTKGLRKFAKKAVPLAMLGLGAAALAKKRKAKALNAITDYDVSGGGTGSLSGKAGYEGMDYLAPKKRYVNPNEETYLQRGKDVGTAIPKIYASEGEFLAKGGRVGCGKAKRGFGRALKKK